MSGFWMIYDCILSPQKVDFKAFLFVQPSTDNGCRVEGFELSATARHRRDLTERLLKET